MSTHIDPRVVELQELAREEGIILPYPPDYICFLEDHGRLVDLVSGEVVYSRLVAAPTASAQAIAYLLAEVGGELSL